MVAEVLIDLLLGIPAWVLSLFPPMELPEFFAPGTGEGTIGGYLATVSENMGSLSNFVPLDLVPGALAIVGTSLAAAVTIIVVRIVASFSTLGGGM
jgi:hypothetical protein